MVFYAQSTITVISHRETETWRQRQTEKGGRGVGGGGGKGGGATREVKTQPTLRVELRPLLQPRSQITISPEIMIFSSLSPLMSDCTGQRVFQLRYAMGEPHSRPNETRPCSKTIHNISAWKFPDSDMYIPLIDSRSA